MGKTISGQKYMNAMKIDAVGRNRAVPFVKHYRAIKYTVLFIINSYPDSKKDFGLIPKLQFNLFNALIKSSGVITEDSLTNLERYLEETL